MAGTFRQSSLALAVLGLLEIRPLHPYGMQQLIRQWAKDDVINVRQRANLYKTVARLAEAGLITAVGVGRDHKYPERTTYEITPEGRALATAWLEDMLAARSNEYPSFPAALSFATMIDAARAGALLQDRHGAAVADLEDLERQAGDAVTYGLPRAVTLDLEYRIAVLRAEVSWLAAVLDDIASDTLHWTRDELKKTAEQQAAEAAK